MPSFLPGTSVVDMALGAATIMRATPGGYLIRLDYSPVEVERPAAALMALAAPPAAGSAAAQASPVQPQPKRPREIDQTTIDARRAVDALRFGVVPASHLEELTIGYDELAAWVGSNLPAPGTPPVAAAVYGPFGTGKSHAMAAVREIAGRQGYLAMATEIDGTEISLSAPKELLASLLDHLTGSAKLDGAAPLLSLIQAATKRRPGERIAGDRSPLLQDTIASIGRLSTAAKFEDIEDLIERFLGSEPTMTRSDFKSLVRDALDWDDYVRMTYARDYDPKALVSHTPADQRPLDFVAALMGYAAVAYAAGYEGLVITIDELEVDDALSTRAKFDKVVRLIAAMRSILYSDDPVDGGLAFFFATVGSENYNQDKVVSLMVDPDTRPAHVLRPWGNRELVELSRRIHALYHRAHGGLGAHDETVAARIARAVDPDAGVRAFIRAYVSALDVQHGPPLVS